MFSSPATRRAQTPKRQQPQQPLSRLQALRTTNHSPAPSIAETIRTERPANEKEKVFWSKDERHSVTSLGELPGEATALIKASDLVVDPVTAQVDGTTGFAMLSSARACIAWNYSKRTHSAPTTYAFPAPIPTSSRSRFPPPVLSALCTSTPEPGMILVSSTGEFRYWESMSLTLSNVERYQQLFLDLPQGDWIERLVKVDGNNFILTTTSSQAYRLSIKSSAGMLSPVVAPLMRPGGMFGRASPLIFGAKHDRFGIRSVTSNGADVYLMAQKSVQKWSLTSDGQKLVQEYDVYEAIGRELFEEWSSANITIILEDIVTIDSDSLAILITYSDATSPSSHALVLLSVHRSNPPIIDRTIPISFTSGQDQRMLDIPKLVIPTGSTMAFVRFGSAVVMLSLDFDTPYEETLTLKDPNNAYIGAGPVTNNINIPCVLLIPAEGGLMNVEALEPRARPDSLNRLSTATARLKSKMEQAIFFGRSDNPLSFELEEDVRGQGDVAEAAELVSGEVVAARSPYTSTIYELRPHLLDRLELLKALVRYIRANGLINQLPQATRRRLSGDGEKVRGALELWDYQNRLMDQSSGQVPSQAKSLLSTSIQVYFSSRHRSLAPSSSPSDELEQDLVRLFFRTEVSNLDKLLAVVFEEFREKQGEGVEMGGRAGWVGEVNQIFIAVERAAAQYREEESDLYAIDREKPAIEMWTASDNLIDSLDHLYTLTEVLIKERTRELGSVIDEAPVTGGPTGRIETGKEELRKEQVVQAMLKRQMGWLAAALCTNMEDKCRVVVRRQMDDGADEQEGIMLKAKWDAMKPRVIRPLVSVDRISEAYELAEHHHDFPTLVMLCNDPIAGQGKGDSRMQVYIEKFGEDFAFELYRWYIDQGQPHALLTQDEVYGSLVTRFFDTHHYPELGWIHNIVCKQYGEAAEALAQVLDEGEGKEENGELDFRKVVGSIAKLASMTDISLRGPSEARDQTFQKIGRQLSLIDIQISLRTYLLSLFPSTARSSRSISKHLGPILTRLSHRPGPESGSAFLALFYNLAERVIGGEAVDLEGMLDLLTLKDNVGREDDGVDALRVLVLDRSLPKARSEVALLAVWRRIYIRDDWADVSNTAGRSEQAQRTKLKETMIYRVLKALRSVPEFPQAAIISPYDTSIPPTTTELSARFPTLSSEGIAALKADYDDEVAMLMEYVEKNGLEERVKEIKRMIEREWEEEQGGEIDEARGAQPESEVVVVEGEDVETDEDVEM
ncbi:Hypothetical protein CGB_H0250C [Cryptococcus gattii WM276]|uniref:Nuclear pore complex protein Nup133 n=1 Tax=Cryptococcus gattii serotype B (strain WM276 / ATCC MYA-4071) TaxID=367775 RepID=E6RA81_CRYGW|nr:Hypothetical protein CGB_H0250C [Cryptococcus gattii WM276]ADV23780.1 Hypothetical protein CGB_H0250C [Cryptococcus gattii WM276]KJE00254.1 nuclear pore complex protein Nup133 [Cryptococcus gattii NT-10]